MLTTHCAWLETPAHEWPLREWCEVTICGKLLSFRVRSNLPERSRGKPKSQIGKFTDSARLRLLKFIACIDWVKIPKATFLTLTYPDQNAIGDKKMRNKHRYLFWRYLEKHLGGKFAGMWRLEWMRRKSGMYRGKALPHWHMIVFGVDGIGKEKVRAMWRKVLNYPGKVQVDCKDAATVERAAIYAAKYAAKGEDLSILDYGPYLNSRGRHYGFLRKALIPLCESRTFHDLTEREVRYLMRAAAERLDWIDGRKIEAFTLLGFNAVDVGINLFKFGIADKVGKK